MLLSSVFNSIFMFLMLNDNVCQFGPEFAIESVGSAGYAIVGMFPGGFKAMLTKAVGPLETYAEHSQLDAAGLAAGWAAAVYIAADDYCEAIGWADDPDMSITDFEGVCLLTRAALAAAGIRHKRKE